ncbi:rhomboid family intramembrane serine protease [Luteolibacter yonseiensis]
MNSNPNTETPPEEDWVHVGRYPSLDQAYEHGLVVLAMGEACRVTESEVPGEWELQAEPHPAPKISEELDAYGREAAPFVIPAWSGKEWTRHPAGWGLTGLWVLVLLAVFYWQDVDYKLADRAASSSVGFIGRGEWWRPFTGLFLHADLAHLMGNLAGGVVFAGLVARSVGPMVGWLLILGCGTLGNALVSRLAYPGSFVSLGASTAVFAALGILCGAGVAEVFHERVKMPWMRIFAPLFAGLVILGWLGGNNDGNTDILGHVFGFGSGVVAGIATGAYEARRSEIRVPSAT